MFNIYNRETMTSNSLLQIECHKKTRLSNLQVCMFSSVSTVHKYVPGSSPGGSRVIRRWGQSWRLWKNTYLITNIERLEMDSVVGRLMEKKRLNNLDYMEQHPCSRWEFSQKNEEQERSDMGESVFPETDPISLFWGLLIYLLLHIGMNTQSRGGQQS